MPAKKKKEPSPNQGFWVVLVIRLSDLADKHPWAAVNFTLCLALLFAVVKWPEADLPNWRTDITSILAKDWLPWSFVAALGLCLYIVSRAYWRMKTGYYKRIEELADRLRGFEAARIPGRLSSGRHDVPLLEVDTQQKEDKK